MKIFMSVALLAMFSMMNPIDPMDSIFLAATKPGQGMCVYEYSRTLDEFGNTIVAAGLFWNEWLELRDRFSAEHLSIEEKLLKGVYERLLPTSGFENFIDLIDYLSQYFTNEWIDARFSYYFPPFVEYNGVLYVHVVRACFSFSKWKMANHVLIRQFGDYAVVQTRTFHSNWANVLGWMEYGVTFQELIKQGLIVERKYYFIFVEGRIDSIIMIADIGVASVTM